jgi:hypothetical protein
MSLIPRTLSLAVACIGAVLAGWGPAVFELLSGRTLPVPIATDEAAMLAWSGVAVLRVLGAAFLIIGGVVAAVQRTPGSPRDSARALAITAGVGTLLALGQTQAIWGPGVGLVLVGVFGALTVAGAIAGWGRAGPLSSA